MKPNWLKRPIPSGKNFNELKQLTRDFGLHTVCEEAKCPNIGECWNKQSLTIMILGDTCTRSCGFCAVKTGKPLSVDHDEPRRVAETLSKLPLQHLVITSVDRDDLPDGGSQIFAETIYKVKALNPGVIVEVLIPDFKGESEFLKKVFEAKPDILNHNLETVKRLQKKVRPQAEYNRSLKVLREAKEFGLVNKSGLMIGLGEKWDEIIQTLQDLRTESKCELLTIGQYLSPDSQHLPVEKYYTPDDFVSLKKIAEEMGFSRVASAPFVRSSYFAEEQYQGIFDQKNLKRVS